MSEEVFFGKLDCNDPEYLAAMEKALEENTKSQQKGRALKGAPKTRRILRKPRLPIYKGVISMKKPNGVGEWDGYSMPDVSLNRKPLSKEEEDKIIAELHKRAEKRLAEQKQPEGKKAG